MTAPKPEPCSAPGCDPPTFCDGCEGEGRPLSEREIARRLAGNAIEEFFAGLQLLGVAKRPRQFVHVERTIDNAEQMMGRALEHAYRAARRVMP